MYTDPLHPWANYLFNKEGDYYIGGALEVLSLPLHYDFRQQRLTPHEVQTLYHKFGWKRQLNVHNMIIYECCYDPITPVMQTAPMLIGGALRVPGATAEEIE